MDETSSADPRALFAYADSGLRIDAELEASSTRLAAVLAEFAATCREYSTGVDSSLADRLRALARRTAEDDLWVRYVAEGFVLADGSNDLASPVEMIAAQMTTGPLSVSDWSVEQRVEYALQRMLAHLPEQLRRQLEAVLTPEMLAWAVGILAVWAVGQALGYGEVTDAIIAVAALVLLGPEAFRAGQELGGFLTGIAGAQTPDDLDVAGQHLATVVSIVGVDGLVALIAHKAGGELKPNAEVPRSGGLEPAPAGAGGEPAPRIGGIDEPAPTDPVQMKRTPPEGSLPPGDPLPNVRQAEISVDKFERYSMDPTNPNNDGKWQAFDGLGYDVQSEAGRAAGAQDVLAQLNKQLPDGRAIVDRETTFGIRYRVETLVQGPNGNQGRLVTIWQVDVGTTVPRLITNWLEAFRAGGT